MHYSLVDLWKSVQNKLPDTAEYRKVSLVVDFHILARADDVDLDALDSAILEFPDSAFFHLIACEHYQQSEAGDCLLHALQGLLCTDSSMHIQRRLLRHAVQKGLTLSLRCFTGFAVSGDEHASLSRLGRKILEQSFLDVQQYIDMLSFDTTGYPYLYGAVRLRAIIRLLLYGPYVGTAYHVSFSIMALFRP